MCPQNALEHRVLERFTQKQVRQIRAPELAYLHRSGHQDARDVGAMLAQGSQQRKRATVMQVEIDERQCQALAATNDRERAGDARRPLHSQAPETAELTHTALISLGQQDNRALPAGQARVVEYEMQLSAARPTIINAFGHTAPDLACDPRRRVAARKVPNFATYVKLDAF